MALGSDRSFRRIRSRDEASSCAEATEATQPVFFQKAAETLQQLLFTLKGLDDDEIASLVSFTKTLRSAGSDAGSQSESQALGAQEGADAASLVSEVPAGSSSVTGSWLPRYEVAPDTSLPARPPPLPAPPLQLPTSTATGRSVDPEDFYESQVLKSAAPEWLPPLPPQSPQESSEPQVLKSAAPQPQWMDPQPPPPSWQETQPLEPQVACSGNLFAKLCEVALLAQGLNNASLLDFLAELRSFFRQREDEISSAKMTIQQQADEIHSLQEALRRKQEKVPSAPGPTDANAKGLLLQLFAEIADASAGKQPLPAYEAVDKAAPSPRPPSEYTDAEDQPGAFMGILLRSRDREIARLQESLQSLEADLAASRWLATQRVEEMESLRRELEETQSALNQQAITVETLAELLGKEGLSSAGARSRVACSSIISNSHASNGFVGITPAAEAAGELEQCESGQLDFSRTVLELSDDDDMSPFIEKRGSKQTCVSAQ